MWNAQFDYGVHKSILRYSLNGSVRELRLDLKGKKQQESR